MHAVAHRTTSVHFSWQEGRRGPANAMQIFFYARRLNHFQRRRDDMPAEFLEQLPKLIQPGRRVAQRLFDARKGRNRERAVLKELIRPVESSVSTHEGECSRMLCG